ncbi:4001_t:CDS:2 [Funneliformis caledonium]|uniref:4001_t:CDS:1 n=1 Tax=Funneliformis caledonium TaxID=1117310 RepID=A0A9N9B724_9GLOM|nr:4001_t:CDS:2 [Funneliformis caledonium]
MNNNNNLSESDKCLLTQLSENNEPSVVIKNKAYFKGNFYENKDNDWKVSDINTFIIEFVFDEMLNKIV